MRSWIRSRSLYGTVTEIAEKISCRRCADTITADETLALKVTNGENVTIAIEKVN